MTTISINRKFLNDICRLCLKQGNSMPSIFEEDDEETDIVLAEKITSIAPIEISPTDGLPTSICHLCRRQVNQFHDFRLLVEMSDKALRSCLKSTQETDVFNIKDLAGDDYKEILNKSDEELDIKDMMSYALLVPTNEGLQVWKVTDLDSQTVDLSRSEPHTSIIPPDEIKKEQKPPMITKLIEPSRDFLKPIDQPLEDTDHSIETMNCQLCFSEFESLEELKNHITEHCLPSEHDPPDQENTVNNQQIVQTPMTLESSEMPSNQQSVKLERSKKPQRPKLLKCRYCDKLFTRMFLKKHYEKCQLRDLQLICNECGKQFSKKSELKYHKGTHLSSPLMCSTCNKYFRNIQSFKMHMKRHTLGSRFNCETCGQSYYTNSELARHVQKHAEKRKYPCHLCDMSFMSKPELNRHMKYHNGVKRFECNLCYKSYYESGHLKVHQRVHTGERPFVCQVCNKGFVTRSKLARHSKIHTKENLAARLEPEIL